MMDSGYYFVVDLLLEGFSRINLSERVIGEDSPAKGETIGRPSQQLSIIHVPC